MAKKKCEVCGANIKKGSNICSSCGMPTIDLNSIAKKKIVSSNVSKPSNIDNRPLNERTLYLVEKLKFLSKLVTVFSLFLLILLLVYSIITLNILLIILCLGLFLCLPFISLPVVWMQVMLENLFELNNRKK